MYHVRIQRGERGPNPPSKITKIYGSLATLVQIPSKIIKLPCQIQCWAIIGTQAKCNLNGVSDWRPDDGPLIVVCRSSLPSLTKNTNKQNKHFLSWTPSDKTFWIHACVREFTTCRSDDSDEPAHKDVGTYPHQLFAHTCLNNEFTPLG